LKVINRWREIIEKAPPTKDCNLCTRMATYFQNENSGISKYFLPSFAKVPKELVLEVSEEPRETAYLIDESEGLHVALVMRRASSYVQRWPMTDLQIVCVV
jgi:hypothetical protein